MSTNWPMRVTRFLPAYATSPALMRIGSCGQSSTTAWFIRRRTPGSFAQMTPLYKKQQGSLGFGLTSHPIHRSAYSGLRENRSGCETSGMKPYSKDLRLRVLAAVDRGMPRKEVARVFGVSEPTIRRYLRLRRETGDVEPKPVPGPPARKGAALEAALPTQARANPDLTLAEHCELFENVHRVWVSTATMSRAFERLGLPLKKSPSQLLSATRKSGSAGARG